VHAHLPFGILISKRRFGMSTDPSSSRTRIAIAAGGVFLLPVLCCGLLLLIAAGAIGAVGAVLGSPWTIGAAAAVLVVAAVAGLASRRRGRQLRGPHLERRHMK
jgi:membrane protein implicated in regulation of membrane protease activity